MIKITRQEENEDFDTIVSYDVYIEKTDAKLVLTSTNPYGFFEFKGKTKLPKLLEGSFTTLDSAKKALIAYEAQAEVPKAPVVAKTSKLPVQ